MQHCLLFIDAGSVAISSVTESFNDGKNAGGWIQSITHRPLVSFRSFEVTTRAKLGCQIKVPQVPVGFIPRALAGIWHL